MPLRPKLLKSLALAGTLALAGCSNIDPAIYAAEKPELRLPDYFNGTIDAWGMFTDRSGKVVKRFTVVMHCDWKTVDGVETGTLDEEFIYSDGTRQRRVWTLRSTGTNRYAGTAGDVVGTATGSVAGNAFQWQYTLALPVDGHVWNVRMDDWMFLMDENVVLNRAAMSKFGIHLGDLTVTFRKRGT